MNSGAEITEHRADLATLVDDAVGNLRPAG